jgi:hypothetical protein
MAVATNQLEYWYPDVAPSRRRQIGMLQVEGTGEGLGQTVDLYLGCRVTESESA